VPLSCTLQALPLLLPLQLLPQLPLLQLHPGSLVLLLQWQEGHRQRCQEQPVLLSLQPHTTPSLLLAPPAQTQQQVQPWPHLPTLGGMHFWKPAC